MAVTLHLCGIQKLSCTYSSGMALSSAASPPSPECFPLIAATCTPASVPFSVDFSDDSTRLVLTSPESASSSSHDKVDLVLSCVNLVLGNLLERCMHVGRLEWTLFAGCGSLADLLRSDVEMLEGGAAGSIRCAAYAMDSLQNSILDHPLQEVSAVYSRA